MKKLDNSEDPLTICIDAQLGNRWLSRGVIVRFKRGDIDEDEWVEKMREGFYDPTDMIEQAIDIKRDFVESLFHYYGNNGNGKKHDTRRRSR